MSDEFYAVQYRNMHTAIHHIAIFSLEEKAKEFHMYIDEEMALPSNDFYETKNFVDDYEIDHSAPPTHCTEAFGELRLIYVADDTLPPDVY